MKENVWTILRIGVREKGQEEEVNYDFIHPLALRIGRAVSNDIVLSSPYSSRRHLLLSWNGEQPVVLDLASTNGTYLNGRRLSGDTAKPLKAGDRLTLKGVEISVAEANEPSQPVIRVEPKHRERTVTKLTGRTCFLTGLQQMFIFVTFLISLTLFLLK